MIALCVTQNILRMEWLKKSLAQKLALPSSEYLLVGDETAEKKYKFTMTETLERQKKMVARGETLLQGRSVFVCSGVAGNKAPKSEELQRIIQAAGGVWLTAVSKLLKEECHSAVIVTSDPPGEQLRTKTVAKAIEKGIPHVTTKWLFDCIMKQELNYDELDV